MVACLKNKLVYNYKLMMIMTDVAILTIATDESYVSEDYDLLA